jgi:hypothetical protein
MSFRAEIVEKIERENFSDGDLNDFRWEGVLVQFTQSAKMHLWEFRLTPHEIMDMINDQVECPEYRRFNKKDTEICSKKDRKIFRIILSKAYCGEINEECWRVIHVEPT